MRRFPSSWDSTLASLGLKRRFRKPKRDQYRRSRRSRLEQLERREMLAADHVVTTHLDTVDANDGVLSLREAIDAASAGDTIRFAEHLHGEAITLQHDQNDDGTPDRFNIDFDLTIEGPGAELLAVSGGGENRVFRLTGGGSVDVTMRDFTIADGYIAGNEYGGGVYSGVNLTLERMTFKDNFAGERGGAVFGGGSNRAVTITDCTFTGNESRQGGAVYLHADQAGRDAYITGSTFVGNHANAGGGGLNVRGGSGDGVVEVTNSTFWDNSAAYYGGAIETWNHSELSVVNSTIYENSAGTEYGGGIIIRSGPTGGHAVVHNSIVSHNTSPKNHRDLHVASGATVDALNNHMTADGDPLLAPLADYGGHTPTLVPLAGSPVIDQGDDDLAVGLEGDQRGGDGFLSSRRVWDAVDIGAAEAGALPIAVGEPIELAEPIGITPYDDASGQTYVATNATGQSAIVWKGDGDEGAGLYVQLLTPEGETATQPRRVDIGQSAAADYLPQVAIDGAGNYAVVWTDDQSAYLRRYLANGAPVDTLPVAVGSTDTSRSATIVSNKAGQLVVAWAGVTGIQYRRFTTRGLTLDAAPRAVGSIDEPVQWATTGRGAAITESGEFYLTWADQAGEVVLLQKFSSGGQPLGEAVGVADANDGSFETPTGFTGLSAEGGAARPFDIVADHNGDAIVSWRQEYAWSYDEGDEQGDLAARHIAYRRYGEESGLGDRIVINAGQYHYATGSNPSFWGMDIEVDAQKPGLAVDQHGRVGVAWAWADAESHFQNPTTWTEEEYSTRLQWFAADDQPFSPTPYELEGFDEDTQTVGRQFHSLSTDSAGRFVLTNTTYDLTPSAITLSAQRFYLPQPVSVVTTDTDVVLTVDAVLFQQPEIVLSSQLLDGERVVTLNGAPTRVRTEDVTALRVTGGAEDTFIDLTRVAEEAFSLNWVTVDGGAGDDVILGSAFPEAIRGGSGADRIVGGAGDDVVYGGDDDDVVLAGLGADVAYGGGGADALRGGEGDDELWGGEGDDELQGETGDDTLEGGAGADRLDGGTGAADTLRGGADDDTFTVTDASADAVSIEDAGGKDTLDLSGASVGVTMGLAGQWTPFGPSGMNLNIHPTTDLEILVGTSSSDFLVGNSLANEIVGGAGDDTLRAFGGVDRLRGGAGKDTYVVLRDPQGAATTIDIDDVSGDGDAIDVGELSGPRAWVTVGEETEDQQFGDLTFVGAGLEAIEEVDGLPAAGSNDPPDLQNIGAQTALDGADLNVALTAPDDNTDDTLTFKLDENAPAGLEIQGDDGDGHANLFWSAGSSTVGEFEVTVRVTDDGYGQLSDFETFLITIGDPPENAAPTIGVDDIQPHEIERSDPDAIPLVVADGDEPTADLNVTLGPGAPYNASVGWSGSDWELIWAPTDEQSGEYTFDVYVTDNGVVDTEMGATPLAVSKTITLKVIDSGSATIDSFDVQYDHDGDDEVANASLVGEVSAPAGLEYMDVAIQYGYSGPGSVEVDDTALIDVPDDDKTKGTFRITPPRWVLADATLINVAAQLRWWDGDADEGAGAYVYGALVELDFTPHLSDNALPSIAELTLQNDTGVDDDNGVSTDPRLKGQVTHDDGPVEGLWVNLYATDDGAETEEDLTEDDFVARVKTDDLGRFEHTPTELHAGANEYWWAIVQEELFDGAVAESSGTELGTNGVPHSLKYIVDQPPKVTGLGLVNDTGGTQDESSDPTLTGSIEDGETGNGNVAGIVVQFDHDDDFTTVEGSAVTDENGDFTYLPTDLTAGAEITVRARAVEWSEFSEQILVTGSGNYKSYGFTYEPTEVDSLTLTAPELKTAPGDGVSEDPNTIVGTVLTSTGAAPGGVVVEVSTESGAGFDAAVIGDAVPDGEGRYEFTAADLPAGAPKDLYVRARYLGAASSTVSNVESIEVTPGELPAPALLEWGLAYDTGDDDSDGVSATHVIRGAVDYAGDMADLVVEYRKSVDGEVHYVSPNDDGEFEFALEDLESAPPEFDPATMEHLHFAQARVRVAGAPAPAPEFDDGLITTYENGDPDTNWYVDGAYNYDTGEWTDDGSSWFDEVFADDGLTYTGEWYGSDFERDWQDAPTAEWESYDFTYKEDEAWAPEITLDPREPEELSKPFIDGILSGVSGDPSGLTLQFEVNGEFDGTTVIGEGGAFRYTPQAVAVEGEEATVTVKLVDPNRKLDDPPLYDVDIVGQPSQDSFEWYVEEAAALVVASLELKSPSGESGGTWEAIDPTLVGSVAGPKDLALLTVEFDYNGDGLADARTLTDGLGEFEFTPEGLTGTANVRARLVNTVEDSVTGEEYNAFGPWKSENWTVVNNVAPVIETFRLALDTGRQGLSHEVLDRVTSDPTLVGKVKDANYFAYVNVEFDHDGDGVVDGWTSTDADGYFRYAPEGLTVGGWDIRARVTEYDPADQMTLGGDWVHVTATGDPADASSFCGFTLKAATAGELTDLELQNSATNGSGHFVDPTLTGTVTDTDTVANVTVKFYRVPDVGEEELIGSAPVQPDGSFTFTPVGLAFNTGAGHTIRAVATETDYLSGDEVSGSVTKEEQFTFGPAGTSAISAGLDDPGNAELIDLFTLPVTGGVSVDTDASSGVEVEEVSVQYVEIALLNVAGDVLEVQTAPATPVADVDSIGQYTVTYEHDLRNAGVDSVNVRAVGFDANGYVFGDWTGAQTIDPPPDLALDVTPQDPEQETLNPHFAGDVLFNGGELYEFNGADVAPQFDVEIDFDGDGVGDEVIALEEGETAFDHELEGMAPGTLVFHARSVLYGAYEESEGVERVLRAEGQWQEVTLQYPDPAPQITEPQFPTETTDPTISGMVASPLGASVAGMTVEIDENGDGLVDGSTLALDDGTFSYTLSGASPGEFAVQVRAIDSVSDTEELVGEWTEFAFTLAPPESPDVASPSLATSLGTIIDPETDEPAPTTDDPVIVGNVTLPEEAVARAVQFDHDGDGLVDGSASVDAFGGFAYRPDTLPHGWTVGFVVRGVAQVGDLSLVGEWSDEFRFFHKSVDPPVVSQLSVADAERGVLEGRATSGGFGQRLQVTFTVPLANGANVERSVWTSDSGYFRYELPQLIEGEFDVTVTAKARDPNGSDLVTGEDRVITLDYAPAALGDLPGAPSLSLKWDTGTNGTDDVTADPTITTTDAFTEWSPQMYVDFDSDATHGASETFASVPVRPDGTIEYLPEGLSEAQHDVYARVRRWNPTSGEFDESAWTSTPLTFTLDASKRVAPSIESFVLHHDPEPTGTPQANEAVFSGTITADGDLGGLTVLFDHNGDGQTDGSTVIKSDGSFLYRAEGIEPSDTALEQTITATVHQTDLWRHVWASPAAPLVFILTRAPLTKNVVYDEPTDAVSGDVYSSLGDANLRIEYQVFGLGGDDLPPAPDHLMDYQAPSPSLGTVAAAGFSIDTSGLPNGPATVVLRAVNVSDVGNLNDAFDYATNAVPGPWQLLSFTVGEAVSPRDVFGFALQEDTGTLGDDQSSNQTVKGTIGQNGEGAFGVVEVRVLENGQELSVHRTTADADGAFAFAPPDLQDGNDYTIEARSVLYDPDTQTELLGDPETLDLEFVDADAATIVDFARVANPGPDDPEVEGSVANQDGSVAGLRVEFDIAIGGETLDGVADASVLTDGNGDFTYTPLNLPQNQDIQIQARVVDWDPVARAYVGSPWDDSVATFQLTQPGPTGPEMGGEIDLTALDKADEAYKDALFALLGEGGELVEIGGGSGDAVDLAGLGSMRVLHRGGADDSSAEDEPFGEVFELNSGWQAEGVSEHSGSLASPQAITRESEADFQLTDRTIDREVVYDDQNDTFTSEVLYTLEFDDYRSHNAAEDAQGVVTDGIEISGSYTFYLDVDQGQLTDGTSPSSNDVYVYEYIQYSYRHAEPVIDPDTGEEIGTTVTWGSYSYTYTAEDEDGSFGESGVEQSFTITESTHQQSRVDLNISDTEELDDETVTTSGTFSGYSSYTSTTQNIGQISVSGGVQTASGTLSIDANGLYDSELDSTVTYTRDLSDDAFEEGTDSLVESTHYSATVAGTKTYTADEFSTTNYDLSESFVTASTQTGAGSEHSGVGGDSDTERTWSYSTESTATTTVQEHGIADTRSGAGQTVDTLQATRQSTAQVTVDGGGASSLEYDDNHGGGQETDSGTATSSYSFNTTSHLTQHASVDAVGDEFTLIADETLQYGAVYSDSSGVAGNSHDDSGESLTDVAYRTESNSSASAGGTVTSSVTRTAAGANVRADFQTSTESTAAVASQSIGTHTDADGHTAPLRNNEAARRTSTTTHEGVYTEDTLTEQADAGPKTEGRVERSRESVAVATHFTGIAGELGGVGSVGDGVQSLVIDNERSYSVETTTSRAESHEEYDYTDDSGEVTRHGTFSETSQQTSDSSHRLVATPGGGFSSTYVGSREDAWASVEETASGAVSEAPGAGGPAHRASTVATTSNVESRTRSKSVFKDAGDQGDTHVSVSSESGGSGHAVMITQGLVTTDSADGPDAYNSVSTATFLTSGTSYGSSTSRSSTDDAVSGEYSRSRSTSVTSSTSSAVGKTRVTEADGDTSSRTDVTTTSHGRANSYGKFTSRTEGDGPDQSTSTARGSSKNKSSVFTSSSGTVTEEDGERESAFSVSSNMNARARVASESDVTEMSGGATLRASASSASESSSRVTSGGSVTTGADGEEEVNVQGETSSSSSTDQDSHFTETTPTGPFGTPRVATGSTDVDVSSTSTASWDAEGGEVTVNSSSTDESGSFESSGHSKSGRYAPGDPGADPEVPKYFMLQTTDSSVSGGPDGPVTSTSSETFERRREYDDFHDTAKRTESVTQTSRHGDEGKYSHSITQQWDKLYEKVESGASETTTSTKTDVGKTTEDFKSEGQSFGDVQKLKRTHNRATTDATKTELTTGFEIYQLRVGFAGIGYRPIEFGTLTTNAFANESSKYQSTHRLGSDGESAVGGTFTATQTTKQGSQDTGSYDEGELEPPPGLPTDTDFNYSDERLSTSFGYTHSQVKSISESGQYYDGDSGRVQSGKFATITTTSASTDSASRKHKRKEWIDLFPADGQYEWFLLEDATNENDYALDYNVTSITGGEYDADSFTESDATRLGSGEWTETQSVDSFDAAGSAYGPLPRHEYGDYTVEGRATFPPTGPLPGLLVPLPATPVERAWAVDDVTIVDTVHPDGTTETTPGAGMVFEADYVDGEYVAPPQNDGGNTQAGEAPGTITPSKAPDLESPASEGTKAFFGSLWDSVKLWDNDEVAENYENLRDAGSGGATAGVAAWAASLGENIGVGNIENARSGRTSLADGNRQLSGLERVGHGALGVFKLGANATGFRGAGKALGKLDEALGAARSAGRGAGGLSGRAGGAADDVGRLADSAPSTAHAGPVKVDVEAPKSNPGVIKNNPANKKIETGIPRSDGGWRERWIRMTDEDYARWLRARHGYYDYVDKLAQRMRLSPDEAKRFRFEQMKQWRTNWLRGFLDNRPY